MSFREISVQELSVIPDAVVIDVREVDEYEAGHVPGAINIPLSELQERVPDVPQGPTIHVICQAGARSARACAFLAEQSDRDGTEFVNIAGGTGGWILEGNAVVVGASPR